MTRLGVSRARRLAGLAVVAVAVVPPAALAVGPSVSSTAAPNAGITLSGVDQTTTYTIPTKVTAPGITTGWNLTITSTTFSTDRRALADTASTITSTSSACA